MEYLSLEQTLRLSQILENQDLEELEELIVQYGFDESLEPDTNYEWISINYPHRKIRH
jgi:hypothetical protein